MSEDAYPRRTLLVTSALPYANGPIHIGHLVEYIQADIWVRYQRMRGHRCIHVCADDGHGTPIMLKAEQEGLTPEGLIEKVGEEHRADFEDFAISFDNYHTTHSAENRELCELIYTRLRDAGHIATRRVLQAFDRAKGMFLPDRYVKGTCPKCGAPDQYGDNCEVCGATYSPSDLSDAVSVISGEPPDMRESEHYFVRLADFETVLRQWIRGERKLDAPASPRSAPPVQKEIANKLDEWFEKGLEDWDISRDAPYFGFKIPDIAEEKYFYVWLDAPIGYMASFRHLCDRDPDLDFDAFWKPDSKAELCHFVGKDIAYFHTLFWPAMLHGAGFRMPSDVFVHGFLTVNGQKMSKRTGTFIKARTFLDHADPEYLRYYFACKLASGIEDMDLNFEDFRQRVNADLVGKVVNIASRCAGFIHRRFEGKLASSLGSAEDLFADVAPTSKRIADLYEAREFAKAMREISAFADRVNRHIDEHKPWNLIKDEATVHRAHEVCTGGLNLFRAIMIWLSPALPKMTMRAGEFLRSNPLRWDDAATALLDRKIAPFEPLLTRIEAKTLEAMVASSVEAAPQAGDARAEDSSLRESGSPDRIGIDDFMKVDLRVAKVIEAEAVEGSDKLIKLRVDVGEEDRRTVFAGIRAAYEPEALVGRHVAIVANLAPRTMRFGVSEAMVLSAGSDDSQGSVFLLEADDGARPGMKVR
ncbi:MAG: methionine--tRNA ligase [Ectothiorhodospiraceae bacterium AqS1]|nr:methionine--tRNA ligase [Ectothiorhodospiraceae bacterium AqS1]